MLPLTCTRAHPVEQSAFGKDGQPRERGGSIMAVVGMVAAEAEAMHVFGGRGGASDVSGALGEEKR